MFNLRGTFQSRLSSSSLIVQRFGLQDKSRWFLRPTGAGMVSIRHTGDLVMLQTIALPPPLRQPA